MSEQIKVKDEPVDPEYDRILAEMKPDPDEIPDGYFDDIVNELDGFIDNVNEQLEDRKLIIPPPADAEIVPRAEAASDSSSDSDDAVDMQLCRARIKELKQLLKYGKQKKRKRHSYSHDRSPSRRRKQSPSRHSRNKGRSRKRSRSSNDRHRHRSKDDSAERGVIQPPKVRKIKEEQAEEQVVGGDDVDKVVEETQETRRERIIKMCVTFIKTFVKPGERPIKTRFFYTPSVIPISGVDHLLEYRSPLNHITNVQFKFNSLSAYVDIQQFGLKTFTDPVTNVSKEIGFDVPQLMDKLSINELPKALKPEQTSSTLSKDGKFHTPFFTDVATQTEAMSCTSCIKRKLKTFAERGVMAVPMRGYKAVQTESEQELPIMNTISLLNSSQLLALNDFSELIRAPAVFLHDVCRLREKLVEIFNVSQRSSMMTTNVAQTGTIQRSTVQQERSLLVRNTQSFNTPMQAQSQNQYTINNQASISHVSQPHYSGSTRHQQNAHQFFNMGTSTPQNHAFPTQSAHTNMNMQYQFQSQNEQNQQHYPQHNMSMTSQYHTPQPVCPPNVRRDDPRHRGKEIDISNAPPPPRSNDPPKTPTFGRGPRNLKSTRRSQADISSEKIKLIKSLYNEKKYSQREIGRIVKVAQSTVSKIIKTPQDVWAEPTSSRMKCGRKSKFSPRGTRQLVRASLPNRWATSTELAARLREEGVEVSARTVRRKLQAEGLNARRPRKKPKLTPTMVAKRLSWTKQLRRLLKIGKISPEASTSGARQQSNFLEPIALTSKNPPKSSTQRSREYRERKKLSQPAKLPPKSQSQRTQEYKERKKLRILHQKIQENEIISRRPRARIWLPKMRLDSVKFLKCLQLQNPAVPMDDWAVIKAEEPQKNSMSFLLLINEDCLTTLEKADYRLRFGIRHAKLKVFRCGNPDADLDPAGFLEDLNLDEEPLAAL